MGLAKRWLDEVNTSESPDADAEAAWYGWMEEETDPDFSDVEIVSDASN